MTRPHQDAETEPCCGPNPLEPLGGPRCIPGMKTRHLSILAVVLLLLTACAEVGAQAPAESAPAKEKTVAKADEKRPAKAEEKTATKSDQKNAKAAKKTFTWPKSCPVTVLGKGAFTPASEAPEGPPKLYDAVWYGTPELYTMINPDGRSSENRWLGGEKTLWWSETFSVSKEPKADIALTAQRLDGKTSYEATQTSHGMRDDIGDFMLVGVTLPEPGCWELTARYGKASLSYVIWVDQKG